MRQTVMYSKRIRERCGVFQDTAAVYRAVLTYLIDVCVSEWDAVKGIRSSVYRQAYIEKLIHHTAKRPLVRYEDFDTRFYKLPSYLRRGAVSKALGIVSSYMSNLENWYAEDPKERGQKPGYPKAGYSFPCMYRMDMYRENGPYSAKIKVYIRNTWDWISVSLRKSDADYIQRHCDVLEESAPVLQKRGKCWYLDFAYTGEYELRNVSDYQGTIIAAVDLGLNNAAAVSIMCHDGTVLGREFLKLPYETDCLRHAVNRIRKAQQHGAGKTPRLWAIADGINDDISVKTAQFIIDTAIKYNADVIVMEHLDSGGKKHGSKKQRLHLWKSQYVQSMAELKAHRQGIRVSRVNAWGTSRLAYDGSGPVLRGKESEKTRNNYSLCEFTTGKVYNCDLNASYNIGARYFVREITKSLPVRERLRLEAKVPSACKRSTCTLSTLISLNAVLTA